MKLIKLTQHDGVATGLSNPPRSIWLNPIHLVTIEQIPPTETSAMAMHNETMIRTSIGAGFAMETMEQIEAMLEAWQPQSDEPKRKRRR